MSSEAALLAEKLTAYRAMFDDACHALFAGGAAVTVELDDDEDAPEPAAAARAAPSRTVAPVSNGGSNSVSGGAVKQSLDRALHAIAEDFAREFNRKLAEAVRIDPSVQMVAPNYEMTPAHVAELTAALAASLETLSARLDTGDLEGARRAALDGWPLLERRIRSKWQAYFVLTFQDVSVERKAARDRRKLQPSFDADAAARLTAADAKLRSMPDLAGDASPARRRVSPWLVVLALLLLAAIGGWLLMRQGHAPPTPGR